MENNGRGHVVWLDNLFTSARLLQKLREFEIGAAGTVRTTNTKREEMDADEVKDEENMEDKEYRQQSTVKSAVNITAKSTIKRISKRIAQRTQQSTVSTQSTQQSTQQSMQQVYIGRFL